MRLVKGDSLKQAILQFHEADSLNSRPPGERALSFRGLLGRFVDVCDAIAYAHSHGVVHRDIKPANILLGPYGETLVVDWGLAKVVGRSDPSPSSAEATLRPSGGSGSSKTQDGTAVGTPAYMSPEQAEGRLENMGPASDVYSLGATLYCLLTGKPPIDEVDIAAALQKSQRGDFLPPRAVNHRVPAVLEAIALRAMANRPDDRYPSARSLAEDVNHWLADEPVWADPEPIWLRIRRWNRRHRSLVAGATGLLAMGFVALAVGTILLREANHRVQEQRDEASRQRDLASENFRSAREAVNTLLTRVSDEQLLKRTSLKPLRQSLLISALNYYQNFIKQRADDPSLKRELAEAYRRVGEITGDLGSREEAITALEEAAKLFRPLHRAGPADEGLNISLGRCLQSLAYIRLRLGQADAGERCLREAIALLEPQEASHPDQAEHGLRLARCYDLLGVVGLVNGHFAEFLPNWDRAITILERTIARHRDDPDARSALALVLNNRSNALVGLDDNAAAEAGYQKSVQLSRSLIAEQPENASFRRQLVIALQNLGEQRLLNGLPKSGTAFLLEAETHCQSLLSADPDSTDHHKWLFKVRCLLSATLGCLGYGARAEKIEAKAREVRVVLEKATGHLDQEERVYLAHLLKYRGRILLDRGRSNEAVSILEAGVGEWELVVRGAPDDWTKVLELDMIRADRIEAALDRGSLSSGEATEGYVKLLRELDTLKSKYEYPRIREARSSLAVTLASHHYRRQAKAHAAAVLAPAIVEFESLLRDHPERPRCRLSLARALALRAQFHRDRGILSDAFADSRRAIELLQALKDEGPGYLYELGAMQAAPVALTKGRTVAESPGLQATDTCLQTLKRCVAEGYDNSFRLQHDSRFDGVKPDPAFHELVRAAVANAGGIVKR
jgi:serine/threonine protein kinase